MSNVITHIQVIATGHSGFLNPSVKDASDRAWSKAARELENKGYTQSSINSDVFVKGLLYARIHKINDWKQTGEEYNEVPHPSRNGMVVRNVIRKGFRHYTSEVHVSKWTVKA